MVPVDLKRSCCSNIMNERNHRNMNPNIEHTDDDEIKLCEVAKHPFGIILVYIQTFIGVLIGIGLAYFLIPSIMDDTDQAFVYATGFAFVVIVLSVIIIFVATLVYHQNRLIVTDRNITQILQYGLFHRKVSQLNMVNVEDVTSIQEGLLATMFGFGSLNIETAGEQVNFHFTFCPRASYYAKVILEAREKILGQHDGNPTVTPSENTTG